MPAAFVAPTDAESSETSSSERDTGNNGDDRDDRDEETEERAEWIYPRNEDGWNAARHDCPVSIFDCRCAAGGVPVQQQRFKQWQEMATRPRDIDQEPTRAVPPMHQWLE